MPGHLIRRLQQISFALFLNEAKAFDVTPVQYAALVAINDHPGIDQTALCNMIAFDRSTIGGVVGRLQRKKLINRINGAHDRRTKSLHITPAGRRLIRDIAPAVRSTQRLILAPLKAGQRSAFMAMLKHLVHLNNAHSRAPLRRKRPGGEEHREPNDSPPPLRGRLIREADREGGVLLSPICCRAVARAIPLPNPPPQGGEGIDLAQIAQRFTNSPAAPTPTAPLRRRWRPRPARHLDPSWRRRARHWRRRRESRRRSPAR